MTEHHGTAAPRQLLEELRRIIRSGHYYPIFQAVFLSAAGTIQFIGRGHHPGYTLACQRDDLLALIQQQSLVVDAQTNASCECHLPGEPTCAGAEAAAP
jgi:hypothetical protein